jgi:hypothetical protein
MLVYTVMQCLEYRGVKRNQILTCLWQKYATGKTHMRMDKLLAKTQISSACRFINLMHKKFLGPAHDL